MAIIEARDASLVPILTACYALGLSRASLYRGRQPVYDTCKPAPNRAASPRRLTELERKEIRDTFHLPEFADQPPAEVYAKLLEQGTYLASIRTMYRVLAEAGETRERRNERPPQAYTRPSLTATAPNVSNDNPFIEAQFKTLKCQPDYPKAFESEVHARGYLRTSFPGTTTTTTTPGSPCLRPPPSSLDKSSISRSYVRLPSPPHIRSTLSVSQTARHGCPGRRPRSTSTHSRTTSSPSTACSLPRRALALRQTTRFGQTRSPARTRSPRVRANAPTRPSHVRLRRSAFPAQRSKAANAP